MAKENNAEQRFLDGGFRRKFIDKLFDGKASFKAYFYSHKWFQYTLLFISIVFFIWALRTSGTI